VAAAALRSAALAKFSLGNDEIAEVRWSRLDLPAMLKASGEDGAHPPLELLIQAAISRTGAPDWVHRVPSVLAGVATIGLAMALAARWFGLGAGAVTGLLLTFAPIHVRYSQEIRPYALGLFLLLASLTALEGYRRSPRRALLGVWFLSVLAAGYTLYFAGLVSALAGLAFLFLYRKAELQLPWRLFPLAVAGWIVLFLPWLRYVLRTAKETPPVARETLDAAWTAHRLQALGTGDWLAEPISAGSWAFWILVVVGIALGAKRKPALACALWLVLGLLAQIAFLQLRPNYPAVRHLLPSWLAACFLAGFAAWQPGRLRRLAGALLVAVVLVFDARTLRAYYDHGRPRWDEVATYLASVREPGEHVVAGNWWVFRNLGYYWYDRQLGLPGVPLEPAWGEVRGPAWLIVAACPRELRGGLEALALRREFPTTNHCEVRYLPEGATLPAPRGICEP
jgi:uncharacterized membrane protein